jgi:mannosyltransferase
MHGSAQSRTSQWLYRLMPLWCALLLLVLTPLWALGRDLWTDEAFSASYAQHPSFAAVLEDVRRNEETPPLYFASLWVWALVLGTSEAALRSFSTAAGLLAAFAFAHFARRQLPPSEALLASAVFAAAPLLSPYMVEIRGYTLTVLLTVSCLAAFERLYHRPASLAAQVGYGLAAAALFLTSYFGVALLAAQQLVWVASLRRRETRRERLVAWLAANGVAAVPVTIWLPDLLRQASDTASVTASFVSGPSDYYWLMLSLLMNAPVRDAWLGLWITLAVMMWGLILLALTSKSSGTNGLIVRSFVLPGLLLLLMVLVMQVVAPRYLIVLLPGAALAVAGGVRMLHLRAPRVAVPLAVVVLLGMVAYRLPAVIAPNTLPQQYFPGTIKPWTELAPVVAENAEPAHDAVLFHPPWDLRVFTYYYTGPELPLLGARDYDVFYGLQGYGIRTSWTLEEAVEATRGYRRVWVFYDQLFHQVPRLPLPYREVGRWYAGGLELVLYEIDSLRNGIDESHD